MPTPSNDWCPEGQDGEHCECWCSGAQDCCCLCGWAGEPTLTFGGQAVRDSFGFIPSRYGYCVVDMNGKFLEFPPDGNRAAPPREYLTVMTVTAKVVVKAYTPEAAAQIARQRLDQGDAAFSDAHIIELTEVTPNER